MPRIFLLLLLLKRSSGVKEEKVLQQQNPKLVIKGAGGVGHLYPNNFSSQIINLFYLLTAYGTTMKILIYHTTKIQLLLLSTLFFMGVCEAGAQGAEGRIVMDIPGYPLVFELNEGETHFIKRSYRNEQVERSIKVVSVKHFTEPNLWFSGDLAPENYSSAEVVLEVSGERLTLLHRPYESPKVVQGLRVYIEATREWARNAELADMKDVEKQVRLSVCLQGEPWGPVDLRFPIKDYRWRSAVYNNTWSSLVPYNKLYYHRGEDYGAIPDILDVVAPMDGKIIATPLPKGDGASNGISILNKDSITFRLSHMNTETIKADYPLGTQVKAGTVLAKTGMTWDGRKSQTNDPHCHISMSYKDTKLATFPYLIEAYQRNYQDPVLAVAGGYLFTNVNTPVQLDANRSLAGEGQKIQSYTWKLHDGNTVHAAKTAIKYARPGLYTEELILTTENGHEDRDYVQVRVNDQNQSKEDLAFGWAYYTPVRDITPGTEILFWNRLIGTHTPVTIDFGDGTESRIIERATTHTYQKKGNYTVRLSSSDKHQNPITLKLEVKVE